MKYTVYLLYICLIASALSCAKEEGYKPDGRLKGLEFTLSHLSPRTGSVQNNVFKDYYRKGEQVKIDLTSNRDIEKIDVVNLNTISVLTTLNVNGTSASYAVPVNNLNIPLGQRASLAFNVYFRDGGVDGFDYPSMKTYNFDVISDVPSIVNFKKQDGTTIELKTTDINISGFSEDAKRGIVASFKPGVISYLDVENSNLLKFGNNGNFSVSFWFQSNDGADDPGMMGTLDWGSSNNKGWLIAYLGGGIRVVAGNGEGTKTDFKQTGVSIKGPDWHFITVTFNRTGEAVIYIDGASVASAAMKPVDIDNGKSVKINQDGTGTYDPKLGAKYASVNFYNYALSATDVAQIYNSTK